MTSVDEYLGAIGPTIPVYRSLDVRVMAVLTNTGWHNLRTQCYLRSAVVARVPRIQEVQSDLLQVRQYRLKPTDLGPLLRKIAAGAWRVERTTFLYTRTRSPGQPSVPYELRASPLWDRSLERWRHPAFEWSGYVLQGSGDSCSDIVGRVQGSWRALEAIVHRSPRLHAATLDELEAEATGVSAPLGAYNSVFEVYAPLEARLDDVECHADRDEIHYSVVAASRAVAGTLRLYITGRSAADRPQHARIVLNARPWRKDGVLVRTSGTVRFPTAHSGRLKLQMGAGEVVHVAQVTEYASGSKSAVRAAYEVFDPGLKVLTQWLFPMRTGHRDRAQTKLEWAVTRLFTFAGFRTDCLDGIGDSSGAVDTLAHLPARRMCLAVESTTSRPNHERKLAKLATRVDDLRAVLPGLIVQGVVVTPLPQAAIPDDDKQVAAAHRIVVVHEDALRRLLTVVAERRAIDDFLDILKGCAAAVA